MPAKDIYYKAVKNALIKDGWTITHDQLKLSFGGKNVYVDFGAERTLAAEKGDERIAVEVKSFVGASELQDFEVALGQYVFYRSILTAVQPDRKLFLAVPNKIYHTTFEEPITRLALDDQKVAIVTFNPQQEVIVKWIP